ncbi:ferredoxin [Saccharopolyspora subtropica]|uniref:Ferredoxin n=1 Tax=Saccharopolyspora thermophila TaxID=89367 RepID=A0A917NGX6_9PSEU|nr:ferredoxin [Saccharopolyspora subtropica]GGJ00233.1 ferredoxin [Saccharopolyspora subtropica]
MSGVRVQVDRSKCVGSGQCLIAAADYFDQDPEGYVTLLPAAQATDLDKNPDVRDAVDKCPSGALSWRHVDD